MIKFNVADYYRLPNKSYCSQTGENEVWRSSRTENGKNILTIIFGDDLVHEMGWTAGDRIAIHQHKKDKKSFFLMSDTMGLKLCKNPGLNIRTYLITKQMDVPVLKLAPCSSWEKQVIEELDNKKVLFITL